MTDTITTDVNKKRKQNGTPWTAQEKNYLRLNFKTKKIKEIAIDLNRTHASVANKAQVMGLKINRRWTEEEGTYVQERLNEIPVSQIAKELFRTTESVREYMKNNNLRVTDEIEITIKDIAPQIGIKDSTLYDAIKSGEMNVIGRLVGASQSFVFDLKDVREYILNKQTYTPLKCYECQAPVVGDIYCDTHLPYGQKRKPKIQTEFTVNIKDLNYREKIKPIIREIRAQSRLSQEEVSDRCGYGRFWYGVFERFDKPMITIDQMIEVLSKMDYEFDIVFKKKVVKKAE